MVAQAFSLWKPPPSPQTPLPTLCMTKGKPNEAGLAFLFLPMIMNFS